MNATITTTTTKSATALALATPRCATEPALETLDVEAPRVPAIGWALEIHDEQGVRRVHLGRRPVVLGTARDADVVIEDAAVSKRHCEVFVHDGGVVLRDLGSRNGTFVGGAQVDVVRAADGTTITIGSSALVCTAHAPSLDDDELGDPLPGVAGRSAAMRRVAAQVRRLAKLSAPVLVWGETGVGKELVARALHTEGPRASGPFVPLNVAALPRELVESELFGHERGAFTGAVARRGGAFSDAEDGTLFLDEIGELPLDAQPKLLRALDGYELRRVGGSGPGWRANVRLVAATHVDLVECVARGDFRRDLFHRLEVFVLELPPLRARPGDVLPIARALLANMEAEIGPRELTPAAVAQLAAHDWPGNVRELRNVLVRAADRAPTRWLDAAAVQRALRRGGAKPTVQLTPKQALEHLDRHRGNVSAAARACGVPRTTFRKLVGLKPA